MKTKHFWPCIKEITSEGTVETVMHEVCCPHHGLPDSIISDFVPEFVSKFWKNLFEMLKVTCNLCLCYHLETDGQAE